MAEAISERLRQLVTTRANGRYECCQSLEAFATERFSIEHIQPRATKSPVRKVRAAMLPVVGTYSFSARRENN